MSPQPGDIFVLAAETRMASAIRLVTNSWASHCGIYLGGGEIFETDAGTHAHVAPVSKYEGFHILWSQFELSPAQREMAVEIALGLVGSRYSRLHTVAILASTLVTVPDIWWDRLDASQGWTCSKTVARIYRMIGSPLLIEKKDARVTPGDIARAILHESSGRTFA